MIQPSPLLTIAIPTWRRASFLAQTLKQIREELCKYDAPLEVEVLVSDNCSPDDTPNVVKREENAGLTLRYVRNDTNIGSDANIAQCFNLASGQYVLILGDDDLPVDGALQSLLTLLKQGTFGVICLQPYGFEDDFRVEYPGGSGSVHVYTNLEAFLTKTGPLMTLISACVINKTLLPNIDARVFCGGNLVQVHLVLLAAIRASANVMVERYSIACKRNNSGGYDFSEVFVASFGNILDRYRSEGLSKKTAEAIETSLLIGYYPFYLLRQRLGNNNTDQQVSTYKIFESRFSQRKLFRWWVAPIITLPRPLAITWGGVTTLVGRTIRGDLLRGITFAMHKLLRKRGMR